MKKQLFLSFILINLCFGVNVFAQVDAVWYEAVAVDIDGNSLTSPANGYGGAASKNRLLEGQDGWVEMTVGEKNTTYYFGLATLNENFYFQKIDYTFKVTNSYLYVMEKGVSKGYIGRYNESDKLKITRVGTTIKYYQNEALVYTSETPSSTDLIVDVCLYTVNATVNNVRTSFDVPEAIVRPGQNVVWTNEIGVTKDFNTITNSGTGWAGAASKNKLAAGKSGWIEMTVDKNTKTRYFGLSSINKDIYGSSIDYTFHLANNIIYVKEKNANKLTIGAYFEGDILSIEREGNKIHYIRNDRIYYTSETPSETDLIIDATLLGAESSITNARTSFPIPQKEQRGFPIIFTEDVGVSISDNNLTKTAANGWSAGTSSKNKLDAGADGWIEMTAKARNKWLTFGLTRTSESLYEGDIDYGIRLYHNGTIYVIEGGTSKGVYGQFYPDDVFSIEREGETILYKRNGVLIYTSTTPSTDALIFDATLYHKDGVIADARASFLYECDTDADGDGICVEADCDDTNPNVPRDPKAECDDGDQNTVNDIIQDDGCTCKGEIKDSTNTDPNIGEIHSFFVPDDHDEDTDIRYSDGKVVIGSDSIVKPVGYQLYVEEGILTEEVVIALKNSGQWADYVFEKDYPLNNIKHVANFIKKNKHLPNVPSAQEMVDKGLKVGEMNAVLLRQIEELWLHLIEMEQRVEGLQEENRALKKPWKLFKKKK